MLENKSKLFFILGGIILYLVSTAASYAAFSVFKRAPAEVVFEMPLPDSISKFAIDPNAPRTEVCPLNGQKFTVQERQVWEKRRPLTVMIENHEESRPQSGLSSADIVYEAVAEGGITRFLAVFYCGISSQDIIVGPVRSARTYYLDWASEYGDWPLYLHVGGAHTPGPANALGQIGDYGWLRNGNDLNQFSLGFKECWRDYERLGHVVATEHTMYCRPERIWEVAAERGLTDVNEDGDAWDEDFTLWSFKEDADVSERGDVGRITFGFWSGYQAYNVVWSYDSATNSYRRENNGAPHTDLNTEQQIQAKNVVIVFARERGPIDEEKHLLYTTTGSGQALVFQDGKATRGTWSKTRRTSRTIFRDSTGSEIEFVRGPIWTEIVPAGNEVEY